MLAPVTRLDIYAHKPQVTRHASTAKVLKLAQKKAPKWLWPVKGRVLTPFQGATSTQQGIDIIAGKEHTVQAAAAGQVVYSGKGMKGYGNLIIIKHDDAFLTAYSHNEEIFVQEGQKVTQGQRIATMATNNQNQQVLHFEVRRQGVPVDPLRYLS